MMKKPTLAIVIIVMAALMTASVMPVQAQLRHENYTRPYNGDYREASDHFTDVIASAMAHRHENSKVLSIDRYLLDEDSLLLWTNGIDTYLSSYDPQEKEVVFEAFSSTYNRSNDIIEISPLKVQGRVVSVADKPGVKVTVEQVGANIVLVGRNAQGEPVMVLYRLTQQQERNYAWTDLVQLIMMGNYQAPDSACAVFGPKMPFYTGYKYDKDPGFFDSYHISQDFKSMDILYGNGRPSKGDPSSPNWGKMPGGGGAAAIMGPMEWKITPTVEGLQVVIIHDEKFVSHEPRIGNEGDKVTLTKVQSPFEGLDGKWAIASVVPLNETLLRLFPKEVLTLMRGEIYARYGDTFKDPATQRYFDAQPWYKRKSGNAPIRLTDVERFNYKLIKYVESTR